MSLVPPWEVTRTETGEGAPAGGSPRRAVGQRLRGVSLRSRLVGILVVALLAALTATGYGVQAVLRGYLIDQTNDQLTRTYGQAVSDARMLQGILRTGGGFGGPTTFSTHLSVDGHPELEQTTTPRSDVVPPTFESITNEAATRAAGRPFTLSSANGGHSWRAVAVPVLLGDVGPGAVTLALPLEGVDLAVSRLRLLTLIFGALVIGLCGLLGWLAIRRAFVPLREVEDTAAAIAAGDLSRRIPERPATTEVGRLTSSLNGMLTQIEGAFHAREASESRTRRFAADASHELRTPLASIRGFAELYRQGAVPPDAVPRTMRRIEDEAKRMGGLVEDLLLLARLDEQRPGRSEPVDLAVLAADAVHDAHGLDPERAVRLIGLDDARGPVPATVIGDEDRLRQVVANLVANAVRHTPAGTAVEVAVGVQSNGTTPSAVLEVRDHGPGLTSEQAERAFERFYRADSSRQRAHGGGSGLGLSIVSAVVAAHHGVVDVRTTPGGGARFVVRLPRVDPSPVIPLTSA